MSKKYKVIIAVFGAIGILWAVAGLTGIIQWYNMPTISNEPALKVGDQFMASNLKKPKRMDLVVFRGFSYDGNKETRVYRLCAIEGDIVEIKNGDLFVNGQNVDKKLNLKHLYTVSKSFADSLPEGLLKESDIAYMDNADSVMVSLENEWLKENFKIKLNRSSPNYSSQEIQTIYSAPWTEDNFGPLKIPANKMFLMGDNRENAYDSRYQGLADESDFMGTVIWKK